MGSIPSIFSVTFYYKEEKKCELGRLFDPGSGCPTPFNFIKVFLQDWMIRITNIVSILGQLSCPQEIALVERVPFFRDFICPNYEAA